MRHEQLLRLTATARYVVLVVVGVPILWSRDELGGRALLVIGTLWLHAQYVTRRSGRAVVLQPLIEGAVVGAVCGLAVDHSPALLSTMVVAPFVGGLLRGVQGVALAAAAQAVALVAVAALTGEVTSATVSQHALTWTIGAVGLGMVGNFVRSAALQPPDGVAAYRAARDLLRELTELSSRLGGSLDVPTIADGVLRLVTERIPAEGLTLYLSREETLVPIMARGGVEPPELQDLAARAIADGDCLLEGDAFAIPLGSTAVVAGIRHAAVADRMSALMTPLVTELEEPEVRLDAAILFADFRDTATADERRRLAREMHDGVAQDLAGLGYLVDALAAQAGSPEQADRFAALRGRLTDVVSEVRRSVLALRSTAAQSDSLEAAITTLAARLSETSGIPIQVTHGEPGPRLRLEVEGELYRITQEAMTNAVKHSCAARIEVDCVVQSPGATITVTDDGRGLQPGRTDSYGLTIMRERARLIGAEVSHREPPGGGTQVLVVLPATGAQASARHPERSGAST